MLKKINYIFSARQKRNIIFLGILILMGSAIETIGVTAIMPIVSIMTDETIIYTNEIYALLGRVVGLTTAKEYVLFLSIALIIIYILKNVFIAVEYSLQYRFTYGNQKKLASRMMKCYIGQEYLYHVDKNVVELQRNISSDTSQFYVVVLALIQLATESMVCVSIIGYLAIMDWITTFGLAGIIGCFYVLFLLVFKKFSINLGKELREENAMANKWILQAFGGIKEVKVLNKEDFFSDNYDRASINIAEIQRKNAMVTILPRPIMETLCICGLLGITAVKIYFGAELKSMMPMLSVFAVGAFRMLPSFNRISGYVSSVLFGKASVDCLYNDIKEIERLVLKEKNAVQEEAVLIDSDIEIGGITFRYPAGKENVLEDINITIPYNKSIAFIGESGSGKTTLADVVLGILSPDKGRIMMGECNVLEHLNAWHKCIGYIPQSIYLMDDTIAANICFGISENEIDEDRVWQALKDAQLDEYVRNLPNGIMTVVGDRGVKLSGGQRQRIGIARALYRNPQILVLDEATSALDNETESAVMEAIESLHGSRTILIIAHRLSTIRKCDYIYEIADKKAILKNKEDIFG